MSVFTVRLNGNPVKNFNTIEDAKKYMVYLTQWQTCEQVRLALIDEAVLKSNLKESKEVLNYIMEK